MIQSSNKAFVEKFIRKNSEFMAPFQIVESLREKDIIITEKELVHFCKTNFITLLTEKQIIKNYVLINAPLMLLTEMMEDLNAKGFKTCNPSLRTYCQEMGVKPITKSERLREYLLKYHKIKDLATMASELKREECSLKNSCRELGFSVFILSKIKQDPINVNNKKRVKQLTSHLFRKVKHDPERKLWAVYNQTGSDTKDGISDIKTTKREIPQARNAFFK